MRIKRLYTSVVSAVVASLLLATSLAWAGITDIRQAIDIAAKQQMLTQRIMGSYAMLGMNFQPEKSKQRLQESVGQFEQQLADLKVFSVTPEVEKQFNSIDKQWSTVKPLLTATPEKAKAVDLWKQTDALLSSSAQAAGLITQASGSARVELINLSGRQQMLSQRLNALYILRAWGVEGFDFSSLFNNGVNEFRSGQSKLEQSELTNEQVKQKLSSVNTSFIWFERSATKQTDKYFPALVVRAADRILADMEEATKLYASKQ